MSLLASAPGTPDKQKKKAAGDPAAYGRFHLFLRQSGNLTEMRSMTLCLLKIFSEGKFFKSYRFGNRLISVYRDGASCKDRKMRFHKLFSSCPQTVLEREH